MWEAAPPGSEWDTSARQAGARPAAPRQASYGHGSSPAKDSYGWPIEPEQPEPAPAPAADSGYSDNSGWDGQADNSGWDGQAAGTYDSPAADADGWGEEGGSVTAAPMLAPTYQPEPTHYTAAPATAPQPSLQHLPPHMVAQQAAGGTTPQPAAAAHPPAAAALSPFAAEYHPSGAATSAVPLAPPAYAAPASQPAPAHSAPAPQAPPLPHPPGGWPASQHPVAAAAAQPPRAKYRPHLPYQDSAEEEVVGDLMSALGI